MVNVNTNDAWLGLCRGFSVEPQIAIRDTVKMLVEQRQVCLSHFGEFWQSTAGLPGGRYGAHTWLSCEGIVRILSGFLNLLLVFRGGLTEQDVCNDDGWNHEY